MNGGDYSFLNGNVGIGTATPQNKLNVVGDGNFTGNVTFGENIIPEITSTGSVGSSVLRWLKGWFNGLDVSGNLNQTNGNATINLPYAEMWAHSDSGSWAGDIITQGIYINLSINSTDTDHSGQTLNGFTYNPTANSLTAEISGLYKASFSVSTGNVGNNQEYQFILSKNNQPENQTDAHRKIGASGDVGNLGGSGFIQLNTGDFINLQARNNDGTADLDLHAINVNFIRIGN